MLMFQFLAKKVSGWTWSNEFGIAFHQSVYVWYEEESQIRLAETKFSSYPYSWGDGAIQRSRVLQEFWAVFMSRFSAMRLSD